MTVIWLTLYLILGGAAGAAVVGLVRVPLGLIERLALVPVAAVIGGTALTIALALPLGLTVFTALAGPLLLLLGALGAATAVGDPRDPWRQAWARAAASWRERRPWALILFVAALAAGLLAVYGHGIFEQRGSLVAGYATVWADWSAGHARATSFAAGGNLPPADPLFSGTPLRFPFLPDLHTATLEVLGLGPAASYMLPRSILVLCGLLLVMELGRRLGLRRRAGAIAVVICLLGGGLGFVGILADACAHHGFGPDRCAAGHLLASPADAVMVGAGVLHDLPGIIAAQPRAYDGLLTDAAQQPLPNLQWHTPLVTWWLPQTSMPYGFAVALGVLLLLLVTAGAPGRHRAEFCLAGVAIGLLPLIHVHSLIVLAIVLPAWALARRRPEWLLTALIAGVLAVPRLVQLALGPHGTEAAGNQFPSIEPGWKWDPSYTGAHLELTPGGVARVLGQTLRLPVTPGYWQFWILNLGFIVPLCATVLVALACRHASGRPGAVARRILGPFPAGLVRFCIPFMLVFAVANLVVFQSWDWDNTKVLVYWYMAASLLAGCLISHWLGPPSGGLRSLASPSRWWRPVAAVGVLAATLLTGVLVVLRLLPWTPAPLNPAGPYALASPSERRLAADVIARTPGRAVFLTTGRVADPVQILAGRASVMGYYGWVWSYGVDFGTRIDDVHTLYRGCGTAAPGTCRVPELLRRYDISFVEIDDRLDDTGVLETGTDLGWWASQGWPVMARNEHIVIYDVRPR